MNDYELKQELEKLIEQLRELKNLDELKIDPLVRKKLKEYIETYDIKRSD